MVLVRYCLPISPFNLLIKIPSNQKCWCYKFIFSSTTSNVSYMSAKDCANLYIFTVSLFIVCQMKQCIVLKVQCLYLRRSIYVLWFFCQTGIKEWHNIPRKPKIKYRISVSKKWYMVSPWNHREVRRTS